MSAVLSSCRKLQSALTPSLQSDSASVGVCPPQGQLDVSAERHSHIAVGEILLMTDEEREAQIRECGRLMQEAMARYEASGCFSDRGDADRYRAEMEGLIRGRSQEQIQRMEAAQAERMAREPGASQEQEGRE